MGMRREGRACEVEEMHSGQESCMRTKGEGECMEGKFSASECTECNLSYKQHV